MADNLPLVDFVPLLVIILTIVIAVFALYKYLKIEKIRSDLVIGIAFLLLTIALIVGLFDSGEEGSFLFDAGLGGLGEYLKLIAYLIFLFAIDPMKVINHLQKK